MDIESQKNTDFEIQRKLNAPMTERFTICISHDMKEKLNILKEKEKIDFSKMVRMFLETVISKIESNAS